jgi:hypothetical protein
MKLTFDAKHFYSFIAFLLLYAGCCSMDKVELKEDGNAIVSVFNPGNADYRVDIVNLSNDVHYTTVKSKDSSYFLFSNIAPGKYQLSLKEINTLPGNVSLLHQFENPLTVKPKKTTLGSVIFPERSFLVDLASGTYEEEFVASELADIPGSLEVTLDTLDLRKAVRMITNDPHRYEELIKEKTPFQICILGRDSFCTTVTDITKPYNFDLKPGRYKVLVTGLDKYEAITESIFTILPSEFLSVQVSNFYENTPPRTD